MRISDWSSDVCSSDLMDAKLMRAAGERLKLDPRRAVAGAFDNPIARFRDQPLVVDVPLFAARSGLLGERQADFALRDVGAADDDRPIGLPRAAIRKGFGEPGPGARGARDEPAARSVLAERWRERRGGT